MGRSLTGPSPTVNTKEALGVVRGMFNTSLGKDFSVDDIGLPSTEVVDRHLEVEFARKGSHALNAFLIFSMLKIDPDILF